MTLDPTNTGQFVLHHVKDAQWLIHDTTHPSTDPAHTVAFVEQNEDDLAAVIWLRGTPLPTQYATPQDALADLCTWASQVERFTRPIDIPHFPPATP